MTRALVLCGGARVPARARKKFDRTIELRLLGDDPTGNLAIENITGSIVRDLHPPYRDLLDIAAYAYLADTEIIRWSERDLLNEKWIRDLHLVVPVLEPELWASPTVLHALTKALNTASGDRFTFAFTKRTPTGEQLFSELRHDPFPRADAVCLFSGGADSLAGVLQATEERRLTPLLVSHRSSSVLDHRQENLRNHLNERRGQRGPLHHVSVWLNRSGSEARENTQRTRGFLFLTLASVLAKELAIPLVLVPENGPVSVNIRKLQQSYNSTLSRTTHPAVLRAYQALVDVIGGPAIRLENPFIFRTKTEVLRELSKFGAEALLEESVSCAHTQGMTKGKPHCGTCSQCVDRRIASIAAGLSNFDPEDRYECDIFAGRIDNAEDRMQVEGHVRLVERILDCELQEDLALELSEIVNVAAELPGTPAQNGQELTAMLKRYADDFVRAYEIEVRKYPYTLFRKLPPTCVLKLAVGQPNGRASPTLDAPIATRLKEINPSSVEIVMGNKHVGDNYELRGQAGAVGRGAHAHDMVFQQRWEELNGALDLPKLAIELGKLREALKAESSSAEHDRLIGEVADAEVAAKGGDGPRVLQRLAKGGKWVLSVAERIGVALTVEAIKRAGDPGAHL